MTNSRIKQAIDETIGKEPLLNDAFVEKVLTKKKSRKTLQWIQPAIALCMMLVLGVALYFLPNEYEQTATVVEVKASILPKEQREVVVKYFDAISKQDAKALQKVANVNTEMVLKEYSIFDFEQPLEVVKTIDEEERVLLYIKLTASDINFLNEIQYVKATGKIELSEQQLFYSYDEIEFPQSIDLEFRPAGYATEMWNFDLNAQQQAYEKVTFDDGTLLHQLKYKEGTLRVIETLEGKFFDLGIFSDGPATFFNGKPGELFILDEKTSIVTLLFKRSDGNYQMINGDLQEDKGITSYLRDFHDEPFFFWGGQEAKVVTVRNGELVSANIFEHAKLDGPSQFYSVEMIGPNVLLKYNEDFFQKSEHYSMLDLEKLTIDKVTYEAKESHLQNIVFINRENYYNQYEFYGNDMKIKLAPEDVEIDGKSEKIYKNIKVRVDGEKYFLTGDDGFTLQLTRKDERTISDEKGNEYITNSKLE
ncbi:hypothetical protein CSE16_17005 [Solibacillus sp. R5-41]|uniref:hypothetical protein n=1 Tax=Solibacillus sp. R5-41 TaxID=2048654 RepID=UPI000C1270FB|nr:hypothetical protein [Solibacillus sp. R5-41]ATP41596.1 hypothetical protein CSE16_17005 [Solibacillus sp. R5-41]